MFHTAFLVTLLLAILIIGLPVEVRNSVVTLPLTRRLNFSNSTINLVQHDEARMAAFRDGRHADSIPMTNYYYKYTAAVGIGSPPTIYNLVVDSGSSVTWVGATTPYVETHTSVSTGQPVAGSYGGVETIAAFSGTLFFDTLTLGGGLTITDFQLGVASTSWGPVKRYDGILGIGPRGLSEGTLPDAPDDTIPTVTDYLVYRGTISRPVVGIFFEPGTDLGEITFGGPDDTKYIGNIIYTRVTSTSPSSNFWGINQRITYGTTSILDLTAGHVDTGCASIKIASDAFVKYQRATGATLDAATRLLRLSPDQYMVLRDLDFHIGNEIFSLTPNGQIWPRSLNSKIPGGVRDGIYLVITDLGKPTDSRLDFVIGYVFMQRFYTVLDGSKSKVGFARTRFTSAIIL